MNKRLFNRKTVYVVWCTNDYSMFKKITGNRPINKTLVNHLKRSFEERLIPIPIIVNENHEVIDGQHRLEGLEQKNLPVYYLVLPGTTNQDMFIANSAGQKWNPTAQIVGRGTELGNYQYLQLTRIMEEYELNSTVAAYLAGVMSTIFQTGKFYLNHMEWGEFERKAKKFHAIQKVCKHYKISITTMMAHGFAYWLRTVDFDHHWFISRLNTTSGKNAFVKLVNLNPDRTASRRGIMKVYNRGIQNDSDKLRLIDM